MTRHRPYTAYSFLCSCTLLISMLFTNIPAHAALKVTFESPATNDTVAGVTVIRGWAYDTVPSVQISSVELFIDDVSQGNIACCTARPDVEAAFPGDANARNSGFGLTTNWGEFPEGPHTIRVVVRTTAGETFVSDTRNITVVRPGNFVFLDQFDTNFDEAEEAFVGLEEGGVICLENVEIREKSSGETKFVKVRYRWQEACQCLTLISTEEDGVCE